MNVTNAITIIGALIIWCITFYKWCEKDSELKKSENDVHYWRRMASYYSGQLEKEKANKKKSNQISYTINCDVDQVVKKVMKEMKERLECLD